MASLYTVTLTITTEAGDVEECREQVYSVYTRHKCPQCGWLNFPRESWGDDANDPFRCEHCNTPRIKDDPSTLLDYCWCDACKRWVHASDFPRHLITKHCALPASENIFNTPGQAVQ